MKFILGQKLDMLQLFDAKGAVVPVTRIQVHPCVVTQVKTKEKDGYTAVQIGSGKKKKLSKSLKGHIKGLPHTTDKAGFRFIKEFRVSSIQGIERGMEISLSSFSSGDIVQMTGTSKGKGFAGVVKRHGFHGHPVSHGHKDQERMPGSIGAGGVQHVLKGKRMGGRMGYTRVTVKNLAVESVDSTANIILVRGSVPGAPKSLVIIQGQGAAVFEKPAAEVQAESLEQVKFSDVLAASGEAVSVETPTVQ